MAHRSEPELLVLHALKLKGFAPPDAVAAHAALDVATVEQLLAAAATAEWVRHRDGRVTGWSLTPAGRAVHAAQLAAEIDAAACREDIAAAYDGFLAHNEAFKAVCTDWQLGDHDPSCIARLADIHAAVTPVLVGLADRMERFSGYSPRLESALLRLQAGDVDAFTKPLSGSYHDVWMELHEDLLSTLGRARTAHDGV